MHNFVWRYADVISAPFLVMGLIYYLCNVIDLHMHCMLGQHPHWSFPKLTWKALPAVVPLHGTLSSAWAIPAKPSSWRPPYSILSIARRSSQEFPQREPPEPPKCTIRPYLVLGPPNSARQKIRLEPGKSARRVVSSRWARLGIHWASRRIDPDWSSTNTTQLWNRGELDEEVRPPLGLCDTSWWKRRPCLMIEPFPRRQLAAKNRQGGEDFELAQLSMAYNFSPTGICFSDLETKSLRDQRTIL